MVPFSETFAVQLHTVAIGYRTTQSLKRFMQRWYTSVWYSKKKITSISHINTLSGLNFAWINFRVFAYLAIFAKFCPWEIFKIAFFTKSPRKMKEIRWKTGWFAKFCPHAKINPLKVPEDQIIPTFLNCRRKHLLTVTGQKFFLGPRILMFL